MGMNEAGGLSGRCERAAEKLSAAYVELAALREELAASKALSVTNIMMDVVPGYDGMGLEIYAKSVAEVSEKLGEDCLQIEALGDRLTAAEQRNATLAKAATAFMEYAESGWDHFPDVSVNLRAALKPTESGASE